MELVIGFVATFVAGGAVGSVGTLLARWILRRVDDPRPRLEQPMHAEVSSLRGEVADIARHVRNLDARLDFTERLLDGALSLAPPTPLESDDHGGTGGAEAPAGR